MATDKNTMVRLNYAKDEMPDWVRDVIDEAFAIECEDARRAGTIGFMTRALVNATMPYKDPKTKVFERKNGDMTMTMLSPAGVPYGKYPRLMMSYLVTESVQKKSKVIELGDTLAAFLRSTANVSHTGGKRGTGTLLSEQMKRLFTSYVTVMQQSKEKGGRGFSFENISLALRGSLDEADMKRLDSIEQADAIDDVDTAIWKAPHENAGKWHSTVELTESFYQECINNPVPIDLRAYRVLSDAPMAMDIYAWATYRASYVRRATRAIPWQALQAQFGSGLPFTDQGLRDFKKAFLKNLELVRIVYPALRVDEESTSKGLVLLPSPTHVPRQLDLL